MENSKNNQFNHFKIHTQFSICEGAIRIDELKDYCSKNKIRSVGISDTSNLSGVLEFSENISKSGTQPIIGTQIQVKFNDEIGLISLIAKNELGYKRIIELSSKSYLENNNLNEPHCTLEDLLIETKNIIILSGGIFSLIGNLFKKGKFKEIETIYNTLKEKFGNNFYIEIQRHNDLI